MYSVEQCRKKAEACVKQAQSAREPERAALLKIAQDWLALADQFAALPTTEPEGSPQRRLTLPPQSRQATS